MLGSAPPPPSSSGRVHLPVTGFTEVLLAAPMAAVGRPRANSATTTAVWMRDQRTGTPCVLRVIHDRKPPFATFVRRTGGLFLLDGAVKSCGIAPEGGRRSRGCAVPRRVPWA